jgi:hypothetical protein
VNNLEAEKTIIFNENKRAISYYKESGNDVSLDSRKAVFSKLQELVTTRTIEGKYK